MSRNNPYRRPNMAIRPRVKIQRYVPPSVKAFKDMERFKKRREKEIPYLMTPEGAMRSGKKVLIRFNYKNKGNPSTMRGIIHKIYNDRVTVVVTLKTIKREDSDRIVDEERMKDDAERQKHGRYDYRI